MDELVARRVSPNGRENPESASYRPERCQFYLITWHVSHFSLSKDFLACDNLRQRHLKLGAGWIAEPACIVGHPIDISFGQIRVAARFDTRLVGRTTIGKRVPDREHHLLVGIELLVSLARRHIHFDERSIGDLVLERDAIAQPSESADIAIGQALGAAFLVHLAANAVARPRVPDESPRLSSSPSAATLTVAETENGLVGYRFDRAQVTEAFAVEEHEPDCTAIDCPVYGGVIDVVTSCRPRLGGRRRQDKLTRRTGLKCPQLHLPRLIGFVEFGIDTRSVHDHSIRIRRSHSSTT